MGKLLKQCFITPKRLQRLYLYFHKTYNFQIVGLGWCTSTYQFTCSFEHVMWNKNVNIFSKSDTAQWWHITPTYQVIFPFDHVVMWYHITKFTLCLHFCKIYKHLDSRISSHMYFWLCRHLMSHDKIKTIFLYFHKMCKCWT